MDGRLLSTSPYSQHPQNGRKETKVLRERKQSHKKVLHSISGTAALKALRAKKYTSSAEIISQDTCIFGRRLNTTRHQYHMDRPLIRKVNVIRYLTPLREGGSLPAIAEADDEFLYVLKFRGAGQGAKALIAELIGGEIARAMGLKIPEIVIANLDETFGRTEPDEEIQDLLKASTGVNLALHYLSGSVTFDPVVTQVNADLASSIVWLDAFLMNVDRTARNTNMLLWQKELWLIDHGAALYFHHSWDNWEQQAERPFELIKDHVLVSRATALDAADQHGRSVLTNELIEHIVALVPDEWLLAGSPFTTVEEHRKAYYTFLTSRISNSSIFVSEAKKYAGK